MTGTALEAAGELRAVYGLRVVRVHQSAAAPKQMPARSFPSPAQMERGRRIGEGGRERRAGPF